ETAAGELSARGRAFGLHTVEVDGQDVRAVHSATVALVTRARQGEGPSFLICHTYRFLGHHVGDIERSYYRTKDEEAWWRGEHDPLKVLGEWLMAEAGIRSEVLAGIDESVNAEVEAAVEFALAAPYPSPVEVDT